MVDYVNGRVSFGGTPVHKAEAGQPVMDSTCIVRKATPEELAEIEEKLARRPQKKDLREQRACSMASLTAARRKQEMQNADEKPVETAADAAPGRPGRKHKGIDKAKFRNRAQAGATTAELAGEFGISTAEVESLAVKCHVVRTLAMNDGKKRQSKTIDAPAAYPQAKEPNEYRYIQPKWLDAVARGLTDGAVEHPNETWRTIPANEHAWRAVRHLIMWLAGDRSDPHIINASMRCMMAFEQEKNGLVADIDAGRKKEG